MSDGVKSEMGEIQIVIEASIRPEVADHVIGGLVNFNNRQAAPSNHMDLAVSAQSGDDIIGGLLGYTNWGWLFIAQLWVAESARGGGVGRRIVEAAEAEARRRGCKHAHVDTLSFQALPFYQRLGYIVFGQLDDYPEGHTRYFLQRRSIA